MWSFIEKIFAGRRSTTDEDKPQHKRKYTPPPATPELSPSNLHFTHVKRKAEEQEEARQSKKRKTTSQAHSSISPTDLNNTVHDDVHDAMRSGALHEQSDASEDTPIMPTPQSLKSRTRVSKVLLQSIGPIDETQTQASRPTTRVLLDQDPDQFAMEQARRRAAATKLPAGSGVWALGEKNLFHHLALRGFEALLPYNWMVDFKTLPLGLFGCGDTHNPAPLLTPLQKTEFRAIRALRELIDLGKLVRDKSLSSPGTSMETTIHRAINKYISFCMSDANVPETALPVYSMTTRRKRQTTDQVLSELIRSLHDLAIRHREYLNIAESVETPTSNLVPVLRSGDAQTYDEADPNNPDIPVLIGIVIVSSLVVLFTLNGYTARPYIDMQDSGTKYLAQFDFSDPGHDVWNALAIAIVATQIRDTMVRLSTQDEDGDTGDEATKVGELKSRISKMSSSPKHKRRDLQSVAQQTGGGDQDDNDPDK